MIDRSKLFAAASRSYQYIVGAALGASAIAFGSPIVAGTTPLHWGILTDQTFWIAASAFGTMAVAGLATIPIWRADSDRRRTLSSLRNVIAASLGSVVAEMATRHSPLVIENDSLVFGSMDQHIEELEFHRADWLLLSTAESNALTSALSALKFVVRSNESISSPPTPNYETVYEKMMAAAIAIGRAQGGDTVPNEQGERLVDEVARVSNEILEISRQEKWPAGK